MSSLPGSNLRQSDGSVTGQTATSTEQVLPRLPSGPRDLPVGSQSTAHVAPTAPMTVSTTIPGSRIVSTLPAEPAITSTTDSVAVAQAGTVPVPAYKFHECLPGQCNDNACPRQVRFRAQLAYRNVTSTGNALRIALEEEFAWKLDSQRLHYEALISNQNQSLQVSEACHESFKVNVDQLRATVRQQAQLIQDMQQEHSKHMADMQLIREVSNQNASLLHKSRQGNTGGRPSEQEDTRLSSQAASSPTQGSRLPSFRRLPSGSRDQGNGGISKLPYWRPAVKPRPITRERLDRNRY